MLVSTLIVESRMTKFLAATDDNWTGLTLDNPALSVCALWTPVVSNATQDHEHEMAYQHRNVATGWAGKAGVTWRMLVVHQVSVEC